MISPEIIGIINQFRAGDIDEKGRDAALGALGSETARQLLDILHGKAISPELQELLLTAKNHIKSAPGLSGPVTEENIEKATQSLSLLFPFLSPLPPQEREAPSAKPTN